jgi:hypothetical protein
VELCGARAGLPVPRLWQEGCTARAGGVGGAVKAGRLGGIEAKLAGRAALADQAVRKVQLPCLTGPYDDPDHGGICLRGLGVR